MLELNFLISGRPPEIFYFSYGIFKTLNLRGRLMIR